MQKHQKTGVDVLFPVTERRQSAIDDVYANYLCWRNDIGPINVLYDRFSLYSAIHL